MLSRASTSLLSRRHIIRNLARGLALMGLALSCSEPTGPDRPSTVVANITITPPLASLNALGATQQLTATTTNASGSVVPATVTWTSQSPAVAAVSSTGLVTAVSNGTAIIAGTVGAVQGTVSITIAQLADTVVITPGTSTISSIGGTRQLSAQVRDSLNQALATQPPILWSSSDIGKATVSASGLVTSVAPGTATITATSAGKAGSAALSVVQVLAQTVVNGDSIQLRALGATQQVTAVAVDSSGAALLTQPTFTWSTSNAAVASVSAGGIVTAATVGTARVTASASGRTDSLLVRVTQVPKAITASDSLTFTSPFDTLQIVAQVRDSLGSVIPGVAVTYSVDNDVVAGVSAAGRVFVRGNGRAEVSASAAGVPSDTTVVIVGVTPPSAAILSATTSSATQVNLSWTDVAGETSYQLERCSGAACSNFAVIFTAAPGTTLYADAALGANVFSYRIRAFTGPIDGAYSNVAGAATMAPAAPVPALAQVSGTALSISWPPVSTATGYEVERCAGSGCTTMTAAASLASNVSQYNDAGLTSGVYRYSVKARTGPLLSAASDTVAGSTHVPASPTLTATTISASRIDLAWNEPVHSTVFELERCVGAGCTDFVTLATLPAGTTSFSHTGLLADSYRYRVTASNGVLNAGPSAAAAANTVVPEAPDLQVSVVSATTVSITWTPSANTSAVELQRCSGTGCTGWVSLDTIENGTSYADVALAAGIYEYRIRAFNGPIPGAYSVSASANSVAPAAPTLTANASGPSQIDLSWSVAANATSYEVERCVGAMCTEFLPLDAPAPGATTLADAGLAPAVYSYRVRAFNGPVAGAYSAIATATTVVPGATSVTATTFSSSQINLSWSTPLNTTAVEIQRCAPAGCTDFTTLATITSGSTAYQDVALLSGSYAYRIRPFNGAVAGAFSAAATANTFVPAAPALAAVVVSATQVNLSWAAVSNATGYEIRRCLDVNCTGVPAIIPVSGTSYSSTGLSQASHTYSVRARNGPIFGARSAAQTVSTIVPLKPTLTATTASNTSINLSWNTVASATQVSLWRCATVNCTNFTSLAVLAPNATSYVDAVAVGGSYTYQLRSANGVIVGTPSDPRTANTFVPAAPVATARVLNDTQNIVEWPAVANATRYDVFWCAGQNCTPNTLLQSSTATSATHAGTSLNIFYEYRVRAVNGPIVGALSLSAGAGLVTYFENDVCALVVCESSISGAAGDHWTFYLDVPAGRDSLIFLLSGGTGNPDLFVRYGAVPTATTPGTLSSTNTSGADRVAIGNPAAGRWYFWVRGNAAYSGWRMRNVVAQFVRDASFELGSNWTYSGSAARIAGVAKTGTWHAALGVNSSGTPVNSDGTISQSIRVPNTVASATLTFEYRITTEEGGLLGCSGCDFLYVRVIDEVTRAVTTVRTLSDANANGSYAFAAVDLSAWRGRPITLRFENNNDASKPTRFRIDDVWMTWSGVVP